MPRSPRFVSLLFVSAMAVMPGACRPIDSPTTLAVAPAGAVGSTAVAGCGDGADCPRATGPVEDGAANADHDGVTPPGDALAAPRGDVAASPGPDVPAKPLEKIATWPFTAWDRAEAITFNHVGYGPGIPLRAYDDTHGWSPKIVERRPITPQQGARAVQWVIATRGEVEVSKCAFPRHAVVLYAGDTPVGSANVCFECGDILVWPDLDPPPDYDNWSDAKQKQQERRYRKQLTAYKKVFPQWERFFGDELGFSLKPVRGL